MHFFDFHSHLDWYEQDCCYNSHYSELFTQLKKFSGTIISASCDEKSFYKNLEICKKSKDFGIFYNKNGLPKIIPTFGIHPKEICNYSPQKIDKKLTLPTVYRNTNVIEF